MNCRNAEPGADRSLRLEGMRLPHSGARRLGRLAGAARSAVAAAVLWVAMGGAGEAQVELRKVKAPTGKQIEVPCKPGTYKNYVDVEPLQFWQCDVDFFVYPVKTPKGRMVDAACMDKIRIWKSGDLAYCKTLMGFSVDKRPSHYDLTLKTKEADEDVQCRGETAFYQDGTLSQCTVVRARIMLEAKEGRPARAVNCHDQNVNFTPEGYAMGCPSYY